MASDFGIFRWILFLHMACAGAHAQAADGATNELHQCGFGAFVPSTISTATVVPIKVVATSGTLTSESIVNILVDANPTTTPAVSPAAQTVTSGTVVSIDGTSGSNLFYKWTQISGPTVTMGGDNTAKMDFVAPVVAAQTEAIFRVAMSYYPITATNTGVHYINSVMILNP